MASLRELKKKLESVRMTGQMAGAMKTAAAVKFARISGVLAEFEPYAAACRDMRSRFGPALAEALPPKNPDAPRLFVLLGANRGLSGGYNSRLYEFADRVFAEAEDFLLIAVGRHALNRYEEQGRPVLRGFVLPDIPAAEDASAVLSFALELYAGGEVSSIELIWQSFVNMLTQEPARRVLLPMDKTDGNERDPGSRVRADGVLYVPDREAVLRAAADACVSADFYAAVTEAAAGSQASTLVAMRTACDNADENAAELEADISHRRQSEVTSGVIETSGQNAAGRQE